MPPTRGSPSQAGGWGQPAEADLFRQNLWDEKGNNARIRLAFLHDVPADKVPPRLRTWHQFRPFGSHEELGQLVRWCAGCLRLQEARLPAASGAGLAGLEPDLPERAKREGTVVSHERRDRVLLPPAGLDTPGPRPRSTFAQVLDFEVVWGDITKAKADVYVAGAYSRVPPQGPLRKLDEALSASLPPGRMLIRDQIDRGLLTARGDVVLLPWDHGRTVAVVGMGHVGSFRAGDLRRLIRNVANSLPRARSFAAVLIGSGGGNLSVPAAVKAMLQGLADAAASGDALSIRRVSLVEYRLDRALEILGEVQQHLSEIQDVLDIRLAPDVAEGEGGHIPREQSAEALLAAVAKAARSPGSREGRALDVLAQTVPRMPELPLLVRKSFRKGALASLPPPGSERERMAVQIITASLGHPVEHAATRVSFFLVGDEIRTAIITQTMTIPERTLSLDPQLVREVVERLTDPDPDKVDGLCRLLRGLLIPEDFAEAVSDRVPLVFEVDRPMAQVHWELMADNQGRPLALEVALARQLRAPYSPPPFRQRPAGPLRALVIGDPGDPEAGESLPGARREAIAVGTLLRNMGLDVVTLIGAPDAAGQGPVPGFTPVTRLDVLGALIQGSFDLLHYSGYGDFDPELPDRVGWVLKGGLLTPGELLQRMAFPPCLVIANACVPARTSLSTASVGPPAGRREAALLNSLAEEFLRGGVQDCIGNAWRIDDAGAVLFAETFYRRALDPVSPGPIGEALLEARKTLKERDATFGTLWASYQHYGDPGRTIVGLPGVSARGEPVQPAQPLRRTGRPQKRAR